MKKTIYRIFIFMIVILLISGCQPVRRPNPNQQGNQGDTQNRGITINPNAQSRQQDMANPTIPYNSDDGTFEGNINVNDLNGRAHRLADELAVLEGIEKAHVVISANAALIGVIPNGNQQQNQNLQERIEARVRTVDPEVDQIFFTQDQRTTREIQALASRLEKGEAVTRVNNEVTDLMRRMTLIR